MCWSLSLPLLSASLRHFSPLIGPYRSRQMAEPDSVLPGVSSCLKEGIFLKFPALFFGHSRGTGPFFPPSYKIWTSPLLGLTIYRVVLFSLVDRRSSHLYVRPYFRLVCVVVDDLISHVERYPAKRNRPQTKKWKMDSPLRKKKERKSRLFDHTAAYCLYLPQWTEAF